MSDDSSKKTWSGWAGDKYNGAYNSYVPWLEDKYLSWYGENKTSYTAKGISIRLSVYPSRTQGLSSPRHTQAEPAHR